MADRQHNSMVYHLVLASCEQTDDMVRRVSRLVLRGFLDAAARFWRMIRDFLSCFSRLGWSSLDLLALSGSSKTS